jgi:hypothetical protein
MDCILAVMKNVNWHDVDCFAISLERCGYQGKKVFFVENITEEARTKLTAMGFELIDFTTPAQALTCHFQTARYLPAAEYLQQHKNEFRYVMWTDVWDVVMQSDPFKWIQGLKKAEMLLVAKEGWLIKNQDINDVWIKKLVSGDEYEQLRQQEVYCSGTIFGESEVMTNLISDIATLNLHDNMQGLDQGMFNVLVRRSPYKEIVRAPEPEEAFVCTCGPFLAPSDPAVWTIKSPVFDRETGLVYEPNGKLFSVVHQYNRHGGLADPNGDWRSILERRYR